ncbi:IDEAL domain-containing protein [Staphylococcus ratti]|uniref:IDEAL domain-containing protein n=1 Tax=Staphylococcus ratti TaxID=2892440 RepID=A0ABY3PB68_9STAP|nr:IDEAL domain-containing protein [Staphylococcus ratti]UEX89536.1 IDEAL domain-containing protein [Staphylococcus ratti]
MNQPIETQLYDTTNAMHMVNQLGVEMIIEDALKNHRKQQLKRLIDEALLNKNEANFKMYTTAYLQLEGPEVETIR